MKKLTAVLLCILLPYTAGATLISTDLASSGDGLLTLDTDSGLEWLDWTVTNGLSATEVLGGAGGWISAGFRYATESEVRALMAAAGITPNGIAQPAEILNAQTLTGLLNTGGSTCSSTASYGMACGIFSDGTGSSLVNISWYTGYAAISAIFGGYGLDYSLAGYGHALVRAVSVPEPPALALLAIGLVLVRLGMRRRRPA